METTLQTHLEREYPIMTSEEYYEEMASMYSNVDGSMYRSYVISIENQRSIFTKGWEAARKEKSDYLKIKALIDAYWRFDDRQQPQSSWHEKQGLLEAIQQLQALPNPIEGEGTEKVSCPTCGSEVIIGGEGETHFYIPKK